MGLKAGRGDCMGFPLPLSLPLSVHSLKEKKLIIFFKKQATIEIFFFFFNEEAETYLHHSIPQ